MKKKDKNEMINVGKSQGKFAFRIVCSVAIKMILIFRMCKVIGCFFINFGDKRQNE